MPNNKQNKSDDELIENTELVDDIDFALQPGNSSLPQNTDCYPNISIKIEREQFSIFELNRRFLKGNVILDPNFQRNLVWDSKKKNELIESVLMGLPLQLIYTTSNADGQHIIIDGKQRLSTFFSFLKNEFSLSNLKILPELNKKKFKDLDPKYQSKIEDFQLFLQVIKPPTPDRIQFDIFDRVNRGGVSLNNQEMRNALYQGPSTKLLDKLATNRNFKNTTGNISKRMKDKYLILRFLAFYIFYNNEDFGPEYKIDYNGDIDEFLGQTMQFLNNLSEEKLNYLQNKFESSIKMIYSILKDDAFRKPSQNTKKKNPINMVLFESFLFLGCFIKDTNTITSIFNNIRSDKYFIETLSKNRDNKNKVEERFTKLKNYIIGGIIC